VTGGSRGIGAVSRSKWRAKAPRRRELRKDRDAAERTAKTFARSAPRCHRSGDVAISPPSRAWSKLRCASSARSTSGRQLRSGRRVRHRLPRSTSKEWHRVIGVDLKRRVLQPAARACRSSSSEARCVIFVSVVGADLCARSVPVLRRQGRRECAHQGLARELGAGGDSCQCDRARVGVVRLWARRWERRSARNDAGVHPAPARRHAGGDRQACRLLASSDASWITGKIYRIDGGAWM